ncbi:MAG: hypothetical protein ACR2JB_06705 [Bryobacteraceae bacterium]
MNIRQIYGALLRLYPAAERKLFAAEMLTVFEEAAEEQRERGWTTFVRFALAELIGLVRGAAAEWIGKFTRGWLHGPVQHADEVTAAQRHIDSILSRMDYAIANHQFARVRSLAEAERQAREKLGLLRESHEIED